MDTHYIKRESLADEIDDCVAYCGVRGVEMRLTTNKDNVSCPECLEKLGKEMTFRNWWKENAVELDDNYSKMDMEWIAEIAWKAALLTK